MASVLARRLGCTDGQLYTIATGVVIAGLLGLAGRPVPTTNAFAAGPPPVVAAPVLPAPVAPAGPAVVLPPAPETPDLPGLAAPQDFGAPPPSAPSAAPQAPPAPSAPTVVLPDRPVLFTTVSSPGAPGGVAVAPDGRVYVGTGNGTSRGVAGPSKIFEHSTSGSLLRATTVTGQKPDHAEGLGALAASPLDSSVHAVDLDSPRVLRFEQATGRQTTALTVPDLGPCLPVPATGPCEPGAVDHAPLPSALAFDDVSGALYVSDAGQATIWRFLVGARAPEPWYQSMDFATGDGPAGLAFVNGVLQVSVAAALDPGNPGAGGVYSITIGIDGSPAQRTLLASFAANERPGPLAADPLGATYVILRGSSTIHAVAAGTSRPVPTAGSPVPLDKPAALAFTGTRLLVANQGSTNDPKRWVVISFPPVAEAPPEG